MMNNKFLYLDTEIANIQEKRFLRIYILELNRKIVFKVYKLYTPELAEKLKNLNILTDCTKQTNFVIKRDGKLSIDINL